jgi:hypothetical protein
VNGHYPRDSKLKNFIRAIGVVQNFNIHNAILPAEEAEKQRFLKMRHRGGLPERRVTYMTRKERTVIDLLRHVNNCLRDHKLELSESGEHQLATYAGEILDNASEHSGRDDWYVVGYMDKADDEHTCEIAIFNFGYTMAESFQNLNPASFAYSQVSPYVELHKTRGWFFDKWKEDDLITLIALQGHVSSKRQSPDSDRGQGTVQMIEYFQRIKKECVGSQGGEARMALVSGATHILFDGRYSLQKDKHGRYVIAFNRNNDLNEPPDRQYVRRLGISFPGTILSIRFPMQQSQIRGARVNVGT